MKEAIERSKEQARGAIDSYFDFLHKAIVSISTGGDAVWRKAKKLL
jgi:hypothetical protein